MTEFLNAFAKAALIGKIFLVIGMVCFILLLNKAQAEPYVVLGGGLTQFNSYANDPAHDNARFCDRGFQCDSDTTDFNYSIGMGMKFDRPMLGLHWAAEAYYADFGKTKLNSQFPPDSEYSVATHSCIGDCSPGNLYTISADWKARGPIFAVLPSYQVKSFNLYGKAGLAVMFVSGHVNVKSPGSSVFVDCGDPCKANSRRYGPVVGAGISYEGFKQFKPFIEVGRIQTFGGGFPGSNSWQTYQMGLRLILR